MENINQNYLKNHILQNIQIRTYSCIDSTNNEAKRNLDLNPCLFVAEEQTNGRGRKGRSFYSPKDKGIYMTLLLENNDDLNDIVKITSYASLCVVKAIKKLTNIQTDIKWVNDIYYQDKKICGILIERFLLNDKAYLIIGIGLNLYPFSVSEELTNIVGFLNFKDDIRNQLIVEIINNLLLFSQNRNSYIDEYKKYSLLLNKEINYYINDEAYHGKVIDIDNDAHLIVLNDNKIVSLSSGEVTVRLKKDKNINN